jgi:hypothetical protein
VITFSPAFIIGCSLQTCLTALSSLFVLSTDTKQNKTKRNKTKRNQGMETKQTSKQQLK